MWSVCFSFLFNLHENRNVSTNFSKTINYNLSGANRAIPVGQTDGRRDVARLRVVSPNRFVTGSSSQGQGLVIRYIRNRNKCPSKYVHLQTITMGVATSTGFISFNTLKVSLYSVWKCQCELQWYVSATKRSHNLGPQSPGWTTIIPFSYLST